jgi:hypothetical protein
MQRKIFVCEKIEQCTEQANCCPHKQPHIKDERCIPKECRFGPKGEEVDCVPFDPEKPKVQVPAPVPVPAVKTVADIVNAPEPVEAHINATVTSKEGDTITGLKLNSLTIDNPLDASPVEEKQPVTELKKKRGGRRRA